jgi:DNA/RNA endonuclease YhcR with UshA esterase domain
MFVIFLIPSAAGADDKEAKPITPEEAAKKVDEKCIVEMEVKSVGRGKGIFFLNSKEKYKDAGNFTVFIDKKAAAAFKKAKIDDPAAYYKDKTIRVEGTVKLYQNRPEIVVAGPEQIKVIEEKEKKKADEKKAEKSK